MLEREVDRHGRENSKALIEYLKGDDTLASQVFKKQVAAAGLDQELGGGLLDRLALSTLPFMATCSIEDEYMSMQRSVRIHARRLPVKLVIAPSTDCFAKMHVAGTVARCCLSIGMITAVHCAALGFVCHQGSDGKNALFSEIRTRLSLVVKPAEHLIKYREDLRRVGASAFLEEIPTVYSLGLENGQINDFIANAPAAEVAFADFLANCTLRFLMLHELAHFQLGHAQLCRLWCDDPEYAQKNLSAGFPDHKARHGMESAADKLGLEMFMEDALFLRRASLSDVLFDRKPTWLETTRLLLLSIDFAVTFLTALNTLSSGRSAIWDDLTDVFSGKINGVYPGLGTRAAYAVPAVLKSLRSRTFIMRLRWWRISTELSKIEHREWVPITWTIWHIAKLRGVFFNEDMTAIKAVENIEESNCDEHAVVRPSDRFAYLNLSHAIQEDAKSAKRWWQARSSAA